MSNSSYKINPPALAREIIECGYVATPEGLGGLAVPIYIAKFNVAKLVLLPTSSSTFENWKSYGMLPDDRN